LVEDISSGSLSGSNRFEDTFLYRGRGDFFPASSSDVMGKEFIANSKLRLPETSYSSDMIEILSNEEESFVSTTHPVNVYYSFEKSAPALISEEMINWFAGMKEFNNLIGDPVNKYRAEYDDLFKVRQRFFSKIGNDIDINRFSEYYKWIDSSIFKALQQLFPASFNMGNDIENVVENHILERNKYRHRINNLEFKVRSQAVVGNMLSTGILPTWKKMFVQMTGSSF
jgi:hypothetical protein